MRIAAYQFGVTGNVCQNMNTIRNAIEQAVEQNVKLLVFPECALAGYPPRDMGRPEDIDDEAVGNAFSFIKEMSDRTGIAVIVGSIAHETGYYNRAYVFRPGEEPVWYGKRALYGWDEENFLPGTEDGVLDIGDCKIGIRICYEIRFPEYFRELYKKHTDMNIVLFNDAADEENAERYGIIKSHLITRAVENATPFLSVNTTVPYQTAPTCFIDASGKVIAECVAGKEEMLIVEFEKKDPSFGEIGRIKESDRLLGIE